MNIKMSFLMLSKSCGRNPLVVDDFLLPFWKNYQNEVVDLFFLVIQNIVAGTATESRKMLGETCLQWKIQFSSSSPVILLQFGSPSNKNALNELFVVIQNIVAGTATVSKRMLNENCIEWKIQLSSKSPVILLQYELKAEKNDIVHLIPVTDYQEVDVNVKTVDDKNIEHKNFKTYDEIQEKPSVLCNFKEELPELLSVLNDKEVIKDKQLSFSSIQENQTKLLSYEMNINTTSNSTKKSSVERRSLGDICVNLPSGSNVPVLQFGKQNGGDEINSETSEVIVSNNVVSSYNIKIYPNRNCKKTFKRKKKKHEKSFHCEACDKSFTTSRDLTYHNKIHTGENPCKSNERKRNHQKKSLLYCEYCSKSFRFLSKLTAHKRTHTGEKPYKCEICNKCFPNSNYITVHKRIHTGQKPFPCDICNKSFIHTSSLNAHKRTHSGEKPFKCDMCTKSFAQSSGLRVHKRIHTGEKPYKCEICNKSFAYSNIMIYHKLNLHS